MMAMYMRERVSLRRIVSLLACFVGFACSSSGPVQRAQPASVAGGGPASTQTAPSGGVGAAAMSAAAGGVSGANPASVGSPTAQAGTSAPTAPPTASASGTAGTPSPATTAAGMSAGHGGTSAPPAVVDGCGTTKLYQVPDDPGERGPWAVGVRTVKIPITGGMLTTEVWYPATLGSEIGMTQATYDLSSWLPAGEGAKIPASENDPQKCDCYRDLPVDAAHGPYPAVIFVHGLGSFRTGSLTTMTQWASRGFIVVAADHPGDYLTDFLASASLGACKGSGGPGADRVRDIDATLAALKDSSGVLGFLGTSIDSTRLALAGHSQGGGAVAGLSSRAHVQVIITLAPLGGGAVSASADLKSVLNVTGMADSVTTYSASRNAYDSSASPKRIVGITGAGHIDVTDLCKSKNQAGKVGIDVAKQHNVCGASVLAGLAQCGDASVTDVAPVIVNYATTAALEETLLCKERKPAFAALKTKFSAVGESLESLK
jgi:dienelactone hydrolase